MGKEREKGFMGKEVMMGEEKKVRRKMGEDGGGGWHSVDMGEVGEDERWWGGEGEVGGDRFHSPPITSLFCTLFRLVTKPISYLNSFCHYCCS